MDQLELQYCGEAGILLVQSLMTLSWASLSLLETALPCPTLYICVSIAITDKIILEVIDLAEC